MNNLLSSLLFVNSY